MIGGLIDAFASSGKVVDAAADAWLAASEAVPAVATLLHRDPRTRHRSGNTGMSKKTAAAFVTSLEDDADIDRHAETVARGSRSCTRLGCLV